MYRFCGEIQLDETLLSSGCIREGERAESRWFLILILVLICVFNPNFIIESPFPNALGKGRGWGRKTVLSSADASGGGQGVGLAARHHRRVVDACATMPPTKFDFRHAGFSSPSLFMGEGPGGGGLSPASTLYRRPLGRPFARSELPRSPRGLPRRRGRAFHGHLHHIRPR